MRGVETGKTSEEYDGGKKAGTIAGVRVRQVEGVREPGQMVDRGMVGRPIHSVWEGSAVDMVVVERFVPRGWLVLFRDRLVAEIWSLRKIEESDPVRGRARGEMLRDHAKRYTFGRVTVSPRGSYHGAWHLCVKWRGKASS